MDMETAIPTFVYIELIGTVVGIVLFVQLWRTTRQLGGQVGTAIRYLTAGVVVFSLAFVISFILDYFQLTGMQNSMATHMSLMVIAMILVVFSAIHFTRLMR